MNWLETTQKFTIATYTKYMNFGRAEETHVTIKKNITDGFILLQREQWYHAPLLL